MSNLWESRKHLRIEGRKWEVLPNGKLNEQGVVDCDSGDSGLKAAVLAIRVKVTLRDPLHQIPESILVDLY